MRAARASLIGKHEVTLPRNPRTTGRSLDEPSRLSRPAGQVDHRIAPRRPGPLRAGKYDDAQPNERPRRGPILRHAYRCSNARRWRERHRTVLRRLRRKGRRPEDRITDRQSRISTLAMARRRRGSLRRACSTSSRVGRDVFARELFEVRRALQADLFRFVERRVGREAVTDGAADHPEGPDADGRRAVDEHRPVRGIVGDPQELVDLGVGRRGVDDRNVEVLQTRPFDGVFLFIRPMLGRLPQVEHGLHAIRLELREVLEPWLTAGAELRVDLEKLRDWRQLGLRRRLQERRQRTAE